MLPPPPPPQLLDPLQALTSLQGTKSAADGAPIKPPTTASAAARRRLQRTNNDMPDGQEFWHVISKQLQVLCLEEFKQALLAHSLVGCPGVITLLCNMATTADLSEAAEEVRGLCCVPSVTAAVSAALPCLYHSTSPSTTVVSVPCPAPLLCTSLLPPPHPLPPPHHPLHDVPAYS